MLLLVLTAVGGCGEQGSGRESSGTPQATAAYSCDVTFGVSNPVSFSSFGSVVSYTGETGGFRWDGAHVQCRDLLSHGGLMVSGACFDSNCGETTDYLAIDYNGGQLDAPIDLVRCRFVGGREPVATEFYISVWPWNYDVELEMSPTLIDCDDTATTSSTTTTTVPTCESETCGSDERCVAGTCVPADTYEIAFRLEDDRALGALQFAVNHDCELGDIPGTAHEADCVLAPGFNSLASFNGGKEGIETCADLEDRVFYNGAPIANLNAGIIAADGISGPVDLFTCRFVATGRAPQPNDFEITLEDWTDPELRFFMPPPRVVVAEIR